MGAPSEFRLLIEQKEQELVGICEHQINALQTKVKKLESELVQTTDNLEQLRQDFQYNLELLEQRDAELERYDISFAALQASVLDGEALLKEARSSLAEAQAQAKQEAKRADDAEALCEQKLVDLREQVERLQWAKEEELLHQRKRFEAQRTELMRQIKEQEEELTTQRRELAAQFEECIRKQEAEAQGSLDEVGIALFKAEQSCRSLERELEDSRAREAELIDLESQLRVAVEDRDADLRSLLWELENTKALKEAQLQEVNRHLSEEDKQRKAMEKEWQRKLLEISGALAAAEAKAAVTAEDAASREKRNAEDLADLEGKLERLTEELRAAEKQKKDSESAHKARERSLREAYEQQEAAWKHQVDTAKAEGRANAKTLETEIQELREALWEKATELDALQTKYQALEASQRSRDAELAGFSAQLVAAGEREKELRRQLLQADKTAADREAQAIGRFEALLIKLQEERDAAQRMQKHAEDRAESLELELSKRPPPEAPPKKFRPPLAPLLVPTPGGEGNIGSLGSSLPVASPLQSPNLLDSSRAPSPPGPEEDALVQENEELRRTLQDLQAQNGAMRSIVGQMRSEMELLHEEPPPGPAPANEVSSEDRTLRGEVDHLKHRLAELTQQLATLLQQADQRTPAGARATEGAQRLASAEANVKRLKEERARLIERSNALQADLNRVRAEAPSKGVSGAGSFQEGKAVSVREASIVCFLEDLAETGARAVQTLQSGHGRDREPDDDIPERDGLNVQGRAVVLEPVEEFQKSKPEWKGKGVEVVMPERVRVRRASTSEVKSNDQAKKDGGTKERMSAPEIMHKGTESQRARLKRAQKRKEEEAAAPLKIRNYNVKDEGHESFERRDLASTRP